MPDSSPSSLSLNIIKILTSKIMTIFQRKEDKGKNSLILVELHIYYPLIFAEL